MSTWLIKGVDCIDINRCEWGNTHPLYVAYHDTEWGVPLHDERALLEFLLLEGAQAGLSWITILKKREAYRQAFDNFDAEKIAGYEAGKLVELMANPGIVRNRMKIQAFVDNARAFLRLREEISSFDAYLWQFVGGQVRQNAWRSLDEIPAKTAESEAMSKDLTRRGFRFVGPTICYAFMQATGMVNDHVVHCFRHAELS